MNYFHLNEEGATTLGIKLIAGRWFPREEVQPPGTTLFAVYTGPIVVTKDYADRLFPKGDALGKVVYGSSSQPLTIVGIVDHMLGSWLTGVNFPSDIMYMAFQPSGPGTRYLVRTAPGMRDQLMRQGGSGARPAQRRARGQLRAHASAVQGPQLHHRRGT